MRLYIAENPTGPEEAAEMATFARSFKPPAYLAPCRRPGMPGRSLSNSSELSIASSASGRSEDAGDIVSSRPTTPSHASSAEEQAPAANNIASNASAANPSWSSHSRPIAIELPRARKNGSATVYTPPEPLSARGDLPGGYFPFHEDPRTRVHRPHPFHQRATETGAMQVDHKTPHPQVGSLVGQGASLPVASYIAPGFHEHSVPTGKYYPSNYERRRSISKNARGSVPESMPCLKSDTQGGPMHRPNSSRSMTSEDETRRKMQQYQRDMIMQAAKALGSANASAQAAAAVALNGEARLASAVPHKPKSPRLAPLGSPGPVTPMELEASAGCYLDKGRGLERRARDGRDGRAASIRHYTTT